jgi:pSer/pThr/pTyr-binding forkhead associated (FHA) protein/MFS family permease
VYVLRVVAGPAEGTERELDGPMPLGRGPDSWLALADDSLVSAAHARMTPVEDGVLVEDLGSRNGTYVNGERLSGPVVAAPGDQVLLGETRIEIGLRAETPATSSEHGDEIVVDVLSPAPGRSFDLSAPREVGRDPTAGVPLVGDDQVSWRHARLTAVPGGVEIEDLGSRNGTFADGEQIVGPTVVSLGTRVHVGNTALLVRGVAPPSPPRFVLHVADGPDTGREAELATAVTVGRDPSVGLQLPADSQVSRVHARVVVDGERVTVEDLGSRNGTFVNGALVTEARALQVGDVVVAGSSVLELRPGVQPGTGTVVLNRPRVATTTIRAVETGPDTGTATHDGRKTWTFLICAFALFMAVLDNLVVLFALPSIQQELNATVQDLEWTVNAFTLAFAVCLLPAATLGDRFGRRRVFAAGIALFTLASVACALSPSIEALLIARAVQGAGAAVITPLSLTVLSAAFPAQKRGLVLGAWSGIAGLAIAVGPVVGGVIVTGLDWQWIFWLNVPIGLLITPLCILLVRESFGASARLDLVGILLSATGLFSVVFGVIRASATGWGSPEVIVALALGAVLLAAFIAWERRVADPLLSLHLFHRSACISGSSGRSSCWRSSSSSSRATPPSRPGFDRCR